VIRFIEYDENGEIFHVAEIHTTEGHLAKPTHAKKVAALIAQREQTTRDELHARTTCGERLIVLADDETAHPDTHRVRDGRIVTR